MNAAGTFQSRAVFPNAIIPSQRLNPVGVAVLGKLPAANLNLDRTQINTPNWTADMKFPQVTKNWQVRFDHALGSKHRFFGRLSQPEYRRGAESGVFPGRLQRPAQRHLQPEYGQPQTSDHDLRRHRRVHAQPDWIVPARVYPGVDLQLHAGRRGESRRSRPARRDCRAPDCSPPGRSSTSARKARLSSAAAPGRASTISGRS